MNKQAFMFKMSAASSVNECMNAIINTLQTKASLQTKKKLIYSRCGSCCSLKINMYLLHEHKSNMPILALVVIGGLRLHASWFPRPLFTTLDS